MAADRRLRVLITLLFLTASSILAAQSIAPAPGVAAGGPTGDKLIQIPLRWCAIKGSIAVTDPAILGEPDTDSVLWRRHERATDLIWTPGANITFRSAVTALVFDKANFPIIPDPLASPGMPGDIVQPAIDRTEFDLAIASCASAWDALAVEFKTPLNGPIALNASQLVRSDGTPVDAEAAIRPTLVTAPLGADVCADPSVITAATNAAIALPDFSTTAPASDDAIMVAHELGHGLYLRHGNGLDDDGDIRYDGITGFCDAETSAAGTASVMTQPLVDATFAITSRQKTESRLVGNATSGAVIDPPAALVPADTISDERTDSVQDVAVESVDLRAAGMIINASHETFYLTHTLFGLVGPDEINQYLMFLDLDADPATGGAPTKLGFSTTFEGVELVARVVVGPDRRAEPTVWRFDGNDFSEITDPSIQATIASALLADTQTPVFDAIMVALPLGIVEMIGPRVQLQASAEQLQSSQEFDVLPGDQPDRRSKEAADLFMTPPEFPVCAATPEQVNRGDTITIEATGFGRPNEEVHIVLGDELIGRATLDQEGNLATEVTIPQEAREGLRLLTIGVEKTALTADCVVQVGDAQ